MSTEEKKSKIEHPLSSVENKEVMASRERRFLKSVMGSKLTRLFLLVTTLWGASAMAGQEKGEGQPQKPRITTLEGVDSDMHTEGRGANWLVEQGFARRLKTQEDLDRAVKTGKIVRLEDSAGVHIRRKQYLEPFAAQFIRDLGEGYVRVFAGSAIDISSTSRPDAKQAEVVGAQKNPFAAAPGKSTHAYGTTFDVAYSSLGYRDGSKKFDPTLAAEQKKWLNDYLGQKHRERVAHTKVEINAKKVVHAFHIITFPAPVPEHIWSQLKSKNHDHES
ncbi:hypothetical protein EXS71_03530 [Candidatus Uhrbacteria bacterium]|nr:hypothetical protein [Candidatus Uhrbacteria bacterium]